MKRLSTVSSLIKCDAGGYLSMTSGSRVIYLINSGYSVSTSRYTCEVLDKR